MRFVASLRVIPIGTCCTSFSSYVAKVERILERFGAKHVLTPMSTILELNSIDELTEILKAIVEDLKSVGVKRIGIDISMDFRFDKELTIEGKLRSVEEKLKGA